MKKKSNYKVIFLILSVLLLVFIFVLYYFKDEKVYILKEYDSNKRLIGTNEYVVRNGDTILNGKFINYNEKGVKISEGQFVNGEINGKCSYYYDNGKIEEVHFRKNKDVTLESIFYNPNGLLEKYVVYDDLGKSSFIIHFDEKGATKYDGHFQIETYQYKYTHNKQFSIKKEQHLKVGDKLKYSYIVANIPNAKRSFKVENLGIDNSKVKRTQKHILPTQIDVEEVLTKKGKNTIRSIVRYEFNDKVTPVFTDTLSFEVNVN
ncbi:hypothetical protein [Flavobacterium sp. FlaQc-48]|uniref:hypothetical protein n=1 Tax=Flavobacterium sp. FlaQc-48 TaxID=3374181 RepID=UPI0037576DAB